MLKITVNTLQALLSDLPQDAYIALKDARNANISLTLLAGGRAVLHQLNTEIQGDSLHGLFDDKQVG